GGAGGGGGGGSGGRRGDRARRERAGDRADRPVAPMSFGGAGFPGAGRLHRNARGIGGLGVGRPRTLPRRRGAGSSPERATAGRRADRRRGGLFGTEPTRVGI